MLHTDFCKKVDEGKWYVSKLKLDKPVKVKYEDVEYTREYMYILWKAQLTYVCSFTPLIYGSEIWIPCEEDIDGVWAKSEGYFGVKSLLNDFKECHEQPDFGEIKQLYPDNEDARFNEEFEYVEEECHCNYFNW